MSSRFIRLSKEDQACWQDIKSVSKFSKTNSEMIVKRIQQDDKKQKSLQGWDIYTGLGGIAYMFYLLGNEKESKRVISEILKKYEKDLAESQYCTFLCGSPGIYALKAVLWNDMDYVKKVLNLKKKALSCESSELLYGKAGYLATLIFLRDKFELSSKDLKDQRDESNPLGDYLCNSDEESDFYQTYQELREIDIQCRWGKYKKLILKEIKEVAKAILKAGEQKHADRLIWKWHDKEYIGAAHGTAGILACLFQAGFKSRKMLDTMKWLQTMRFPDGNYQTRPDSHKNELVQWCHGAGGIGLLFAQLADQMSEQRLKKSYYSYTDAGDDKKIKPFRPHPEYLSLAEDCAEHLFKKGFLQKGISLCHGSLGNALLFLKLYRLTKKKIWRQRALIFAKLILDPRHANLWNQADQKLCFANGLAGAAYFFSALDDKNPIFPLMEAQVHYS